MTNSNILVLVEMDEHNASDLSLEMLGCARQLADKNDKGDVIAVVFGDKFGTLGEDLGGGGLVSASLSPDSESVEMWVRRVVRWMLELLETL